MESEQLQIENEALGVIIRESASNAIIATGISWDDYMEHYAANFAEWQPTLPDAAATARLVEAMMVAS